jgi:excisionase family DNA binding protein
MTPFLTGDECISIQLIHMEKLYLKSEIANYLRVSEFTINRWLMIGKLKGIKFVNGTWRIPQSALDDFMNVNMVAPLYKKGVLLPEKDPYASENSGGTSPDLASDFEKSLDSPDTYDEYDGKPANLIWPERPNTSTNPRFHNPPKPKKTSDKNNKNDKKTYKKQPENPPENT